jgi:hypothetical protein
MRKKLGGAGRSPSGSRLDAMRANRIVRAAAVLGVFAVVGICLYVASLIGARLTACPEINAGTQDGISFIGQGVSLWPVGAKCHDPIRNVSYVYEAAGWLNVALPIVGLLGTSAVAAALLIRPRVSSLSQPET